MPSLLLGAAIAGVALLLLGYGLARLAELARDRRSGRLIGVDDAALPVGTLRAPEWRLSGRPDELRRSADGRIVPIEWKSRSAPVRGPFPSHRMQVLAYLALVEASTGRAPPYGVLRYGDGQEFRIAWDGPGRAELARVRAALDRPYDGRHLASASKCAGCRFRTICDVRA